MNQFNQGWACRWSDIANTTPVGGFIEYKYGFWIAPGRFDRDMCDGHTLKGYFDD